MSDAVRAAAVSAIRAEADRIQREARALLAPNSVYYWTGRLPRGDDGRVLTPKP